MSKLWALHQRRHTTYKFTSFYFIGVGKPWSERQAIGQAVNYEEVLSFDFCVLFSSFCLNCFPFLTTDTCTCTGVSPNLTLLQPFAFHSISCVYIFKKFPRLPKLGDILTK